MSVPPSQSWRSKAFLIIAAKLFILWMYHSLPNHCTANGHSGCVQGLLFETIYFSIKSNAANNLVHVIYISLSPSTFIIQDRFLQAISLDQIAQAFLFYQLKLINFSKLATVDTHYWTSHVVQVVKNSPANSGDLRDVCLIPGLGRCPRGGHGNPLQYSCLDNSMDRGAWRATVHKIAKRWI